MGRHRTSNAVTASVTKDNNREEETETDRAPSMGKTNGRAGFVALGRRARLGVWRGGARRWAPRAACAGGCRGWRLLAGRVEEREGIGEKERGAAREREIRGERE
jgi:hypothetical protein